VGGGDTGRMSERNGDERPDFQTRFRMGMGFSLHARSDKWQSGKRI
jgi:hypothetical protein